MDNVLSPDAVVQGGDAFSWISASATKETVQKQSCSQCEEDQESSEETRAHHRRDQEKQSH
jgi:hypothetical protein